jgi:hypothetical protein
MKDEAVISSSLLPTKKPAIWLASSDANDERERNSFILILSKSLSTGYKYSFEPYDHSHRKSLSEYSAGIAALCAS